MRIPTSSLMSPIGFTLPLVGEDHPLRKRFQRTFLWSATMAILIHAVVASGRFAVARSLEARLTPIVRPVRHPIVLVNPISIEVVAHSRPGVSLAALVKQERFTIPEPVPDFDARELTVPSTDDIATPNGAVASLTSGGDSFVESSGDAIPSPNEYVAVEEMPQLINAAEIQRALIDLYPEMAKSAGVEGTVSLKVYVGKAGDVENVIVVDGPPMLRDAAKQAVKHAKFKPALQQHHPVGIWVAWPVVFSLHS